MAEKIVCSAIKITNVNDIYDGIHLGLRHNDCLKTIHRIRVLVGDTDEWRIKYLRNSEQGFLTSKNRFVNRVEAMEIAESQNQIIKKHGNGTKLFSECLY